MWWIVIVYVYVFATSAPRETACCYRDRWFSPRCKQSFSMNRATGWGSEARTQAPQGQNCVSLGALFLEGHLGSGLICACIHQNHQMGVTACASVVNPPLAGAGIIYVRAAACMPDVLHLGCSSAATRAEAEVQHRAHLFFSSHTHVPYTPRLAAALAFP